MNTPQENQRTAFTLNEIHQLRAEKLAEIRTSKQRIANHARELFHPSETTNGANSLMNNFHSGMAIFNGVMTGFKIIKRIRNFFKK
jgi:hypothetical protein